MDPRAHRAIRTVPGANVTTAVATTSLAETRVTTATPAPLTDAWTTITTVNRVALNQMVPGAAKEPRYVPGTNAIKAIVTSWLQQTRVTTAIPALLTAAWTTTTIA